MTQKQVAELLILHVKAVQESHHAGFLYASGQPWEDQQSKVNDINAEFCIKLQIWTSDEPLREIPNLSSKP